LDCTAGDLHVLGAEGGEAEGGDDDGCEARRGGVGDRAAEGHEEEEPGLWVEGGLTDLVGFEVTVFDSLSVGGNALAGDGALAGSEESGV